MGPYQPWNFVQDKVYNVHRQLGLEMIDLWNKASNEERYKLVLNKGYLQGILEGLEEKYIYDEQHARNNNKSKIGRE